MLIDLHLPVAPDDEETALDALLDAATAKGLAGLCLLGGAALAPAAALAAARSREGLLVLPGARVVADLGVLLVFFPEITDAVASGDWLPGCAGTPAAQNVIDAAAAHGGVVIAAHPYGRNEGLPRMADHLLELKGLAAVEVRSGSQANQANELALEAACLLGLPGVGGSGKAAALGNAATLVGRPVSRLADLVEAIRAADVWAAEVNPVLSTPAPRPEGDRRPRRDERGRDDRGPRGGGRGGSGRGGGDRDRGGRSGGGGRGGRGGRGGGGGRQRS